ncbi:hypothetical protein BJ742DRAFT_869266 [Cladochytrium replicatum]|nr:hypothetical protein BJ742DRAFT_869266 [Cladochytrium replicatum]
MTMLLTISLLLALSALLTPSLAIQNTAPPSFRSIELAQFKNVDVLDKFGAFRLYWTVDRVVELEDEKESTRDNKDSASGSSSPSPTRTSASSLRTSNRVTTTTTTSRTTTTSTSSRPVQVSGIPGIPGDDDDDDVRLEDLTTTRRATTSRATTRTTTTGPPARASPIRLPPRIDDDDDDDDDRNDDDDDDDERSGRDGRRRGDDDDVDDDRDDDSEDDRRRSKLARRQNVSISSRDEPVLVSLHLCLVLDPTAKGKLTAEKIVSTTAAWMGMGFGEHMLDAEFVIAHLQDPPASSAVIAPLSGLSSYVATHYYMPPAKTSNTNDRFTMTPGVSVIENGTMIAEFKITNLTVQDGLQSLLFAYNPRAPKTSLNGWMGFHDDRYYRFMMNTLITDEASPLYRIDVVSLQAKKVHGAGFAVTLLLFTVAAYFSRYLKYWSIWIYVHVICASIALLLVVVFTIVIFVNMPSEPDTFLGIDAGQPHTILGLVLILLLMLQSILGVLNLSSLRFEFIENHRTVIRLAHKLMGWLTIITMFAQTIVGVEVIYPLQENRGREAWYFALVVMTLLIGGFGVSEFFHQRNRNDLNIVEQWIAKHFGSLTRNKKQGADYRDFGFVDKKGYGHVDALAKSMGGKGKNGGYEAVQPGEKAIAELMSQALVKSPENLRSYTWADIAEATKNGEILVVANRKYVYSVDTWVKSHPGGQLVLYSVAGTDVTNDFFKEAGYDATDFMIKAPRPESFSDVSGMRRRLPSTASANIPVAQVLMSPSAMHQQFDSQMSVLYPDPQQQFHMPTSPVTRPSPHEEQNVFELTEGELKHLLRARRPHVHTKSAIQKFSTFLVGQLVQSKTGSIDGMVAKGGLDPTEYRRYALVENTLLNEGSAATAKISNVAGVVHKLKFVLLYPSDPNRAAARNDDLTPFLPGECVEIQARVSAKNPDTGKSSMQWVSRYFTPLSGSPACFEVYIKFKSSGALSPFLCNLKPGSRQIRIRAPFGTSIISRANVKPSGVPSMPPMPSTVGTAGGIPPMPTGFGSTTTSESGYSGRPNVRIVTSMIGSNSTVSSNASLTAPPTWYRKYLFFTAGSGLTPALHIIQYLFLPLDVPLLVHTAYFPTSQDEIALKPGEHVVAKWHSLDGWAHGRNLATGAEGVFPLPVTYPRTVKSKSDAAKIPTVVVLHSIRYAVEAFGLDLIRGAALAYPNHVKIAHCVSQPHTYKPSSTSNSSGSSGLVRKKSVGDVGGDPLRRLQGMCAGYVENNGAEWTGESDLAPGTHVVFGRRLEASIVGWTVKEFAGWRREDVDVGRAVYVCGPRSFEGFVYEALVEGLAEDDECRVDHEEVVVLPDDHYV